MSLREVRRNSKIKKRGRFAVPKFCGWPVLETFYTKCPSDEVKGLFSTLFSTGTRISEALQLHKDMFIIDDDEWLTVYRAPVLKKGKNAKMGSNYRNIPINRNESMTQYMMQYVNECEGFLFERSRQWAWQNITSVDDRWWNHRIRSERATQLHVEYDYQVPELMKWFNWSTPQEALEYVRLGTEDLKNKVNKSRSLP